jgi:hypothetical protein
MKNEETILDPVQLVVLYKKTTGKVVSSGSSQNAETLGTAELDVLIGYSAIPNKSYVINGVVVDIPPQPDSNYVFNWVTKVWEQDYNVALTAVQFKRDNLLSASDWIVTKAMDVGTPVPEDWKVYRQALRDITLQPDIFNIIWPTAPQG